MTEAENKIRNEKDTKDLTEFELKEKVRIIQREVAQMNSQFLKLAEQTHDLYQKRTKRKKYLAQLRQDLKNKRFAI